MATKEINLKWNEEGSTPTRQFSADSVTKQQLFVGGGILNNLIVTQAAAGAIYVQVYDTDNDDLGSVTPIITIATQEGTVSLTIPVVLSDGCVIAISDAPNSFNEPSIDALVFAQFRA